MPASAAMVGKTDCPYCEAAEAWYKEHGIPVTKTLIEDRAEREKFYDSLGLVGDERRVPQNFIREDGETIVEPIGGFSKLKNSGAESLFR